MKASSQIWVGKGHYCLVKEDVPVDNFWYLDGELGFWDIDLFDNLVMELGNLEENFCIVELGLDKQEGVLGSLTVRHHSWEQHPGREMEFGRVEDDLGKWEMDFGNCGVDFDIRELGRLDKWRQYFDYWDD